MIIVDTPFHVSFRSMCDYPILACESSCKKVYWNGDLKSVECMQCGGKLCRAVKGIHYKVVKTSNYNLRMSDFTNYGNFSKKEMNMVKGLVDQDAGILHLSSVKKGFEEKAREWVKGQGC